MKQALLKRTFQAAVLIGTQAGGLAVAHAADLFWVDDAGDFNGAFIDTNHWSDTLGGAGGFSAPGAADVAIFDNNQPSAYEVDLLSSQLLDGFVVRNDQVTLDVHNATLDLGSGEFRIGSAGETAVLTLTSSTTSKGIVIARANSQMEIGKGTNADGTLIVENGARFQRTGGGNPVIGSGAGAVGRLIVDGGQAEVSGSSVIFGESSGHAIIDVRNGGTLITNGDMLIATTGAAVVDITLDAATWRHTHSGRHVVWGSTQTGQGAGVANVTIRNGSTFTVSSSIMIANHERASGKTINMLVTGANTRVRSVSQYVGGSSAMAIRSDHNLTIADGAVVSVRDVFRVWHQVAGTGVSDVPTVTLDDGVVEVDAAGQVLLDGLLQGNGVIRRRSGSGSEAITMNVSNTGVVRPGLSIGTIELENTNLATAGTLDVELSGDGAGEYDRLILTTTGHTATIDGGQVQVSVLPSFAAFQMKPGDVFDLIIADTVLINTLPTLSFTDAHFDGVLLPGVATSGGTLGAGQESLRLMLTVVIPEPTTALIGLTGALACSLRRPGRRQG